MKALKKYLEKNKELEQGFGELVQRFARSIDPGGVGAADDAEENSTVEALLASLKKHKPDEEGAPRRDRMRTREERVRDAEGEKTRIARLEATEAALQTKAAALDPSATASKRSPLQPATASHRLAYTIAVVCIVGFIAGAAGLYASRRSM
jgi:predicted ribosome quality control (RQC) complex YloA/Tae2 family protein